MSKTSLNYKNHHGGYNELLNRDNYDVWAPTMKRELQGRDLWSFCDNTREEPAALPPNASATERLLHRVTTKEHRAEKAATGSYIYHACNKQIQDRYLSDITFNNPQAIWERLKEKVQGNDADSRSRLLSKFMSLTKQKDQNMQQFAKKLTTIQGLLNPADAAATKFITDKMVLGQIYKNAGSNLHSLTINLQTNQDLTLAQVLRRYELAEEALEISEIDPQDVDHVSALNVNKSQSGSRPRQVSLPACPEDWSTTGCWFHNSGSHHATDCDGLKAIQHRFLENNNISVDKAPTRKGYPPPGSIPRRTQRTPKSNLSKPPPNGASDVTRKRPMCNLCSTSGHYTDKCPSLNEAVSAWKKQKSVTANVAEAP